MSFLFLEDGSTGSQQTNRLLTKHIDITYGSEPNFWDDQLKQDRDLPELLQIESRTKTLMIEYLVKNSQN